MLPIKGNPRGQVAFGLCQVVLKLVPLKGRKALIVQYPQHENGTFRFNSSYSVANYRRNTMSVTFKGEVK